MKIQPFLVANGDISLVNPIDSGVGSTVSLFGLPMKKQPAPDFPTTPNSAKPNLDSKAPAAASES
jgi:hypothetical protein